MWNSNPKEGRRFKGTQKVPDCNRWTSRIGFNGKRFYLGIFRTEEDAARVYDGKAKEFLENMPELTFESGRIGYDSRIIRR